MGIKSKVILKNEGDINYPWLGTSAGLVVLFSKHQQGVVVSIGGNEVWAVGETSKNWDMFGFTHFEGSITLENT